MSLHRAIQKRFICSSVRLYCRLPLQRLPSVSVDYLDFTCTSISPRVSAEMDRARAAGYIDNNFVQNQQRLRKRRDHLARIHKIKTRKPGTSVTLDNNPPVVQQATAEDPRKKAKRGLFSVIIERENKVLLQRISAILMEPARNTVKEYDAMKKLIVPKNQGRARMYDQHMQKVRNDKFFESLRSQKPVYNVKTWEKDYEHQKYNQRFMREVKYSRPPGFVDPYAPTPESAAESTAAKAARLAEAKKGAGSNSPAKDGASSAHINRVRSIRADNKGRSSNDGFASSGNSHQGAGAHRHHHGKSGDHSAGSENYDNDGYEEDGYEDDLEEFKELLAEARRDIRVSEEVAAPGSISASAQQQSSSRSVGSTASAGEIKLNVYMATAELRCWLVNGEVIVLSAHVQEGAGAGDRQLDAEAEISLEDLAVLRGEDPSLLPAHPHHPHPLRDDDSHGAPHQEGSSVYSLPFDMATLQQIAVEMVSHVELRVDLESGARLILNLVSEEDPLGPGLGDLDADFEFAGGTDHGSAAGSRSGAAGPAGGNSNHWNQSSTHSLNHVHGGAGAAGTHPRPQDPEHDSLVSEEELGDMLIDDNKMTLLNTGVKVPVHFENQVITASVANLGSLIDAAKIKSRHDFVYALVKAVSTEDDQMCVTVNVMTNTATQFKRFARPAVVKGTIMKISTSLPSVIHADPDLIVVFAQNLVANIKIVHSNRTGKNSLSIENL